MFIRLDDLSYNSDLEKWSLMFNILEANSITAIVGVIPSNKDGDFTKCDFKAEEDFWKYVRVLQEKGNSIFLHGFQHLCNSRGYGDFCKGTLGGETLGSVEKQRILLTSAARCFLDNGVRIDGFMAPRHNFDHNTLKVLNILNVRIVSDRYFTEPIIEKHITYIPVHYSKLPSRPLFSKSTVCLHPENMSTHDILSFGDDLKTSKIIFEKPENTIKTVTSPSFFNSLVDYLWRHYVRYKGFIWRTYKRLC